MGRVLIVYYSRTGHTQRVAEEVAAACGATVERIHDKARRSGLFAYLRCAWDALHKRATPIQDPTEHPAQFDVVALDALVWAGNIPPPMRSYIAAQLAKFPRVAFFCTLGGSGAEKVFADMATLCETKPIAALVVTAKELKASAYRTKIEAFAGTLKD